MLAVLWAVGVARLKITEIKRVVRRIRGERRRREGKRIWRFCYGRVGEWAKAVVLTFSVSEGLTSGERDQPHHSC